MPRVDERNLPPRPITALHDYFEAASRPGTQHEPSPVASESAQATRLLSNVERATARIVVGAPSEGVGVLHEAVARLRVLDARGTLARLSGHVVAQTLQSVLHNSHPRAIRYAARGWMTLELCDRLDLIQVWLSTPDHDDLRHFRRVRLHERMTEIRTRANSGNTMSTLCLSAPVG
jgi:hypothetical protein